MKALNRIFLASYKYIVVMLLFILVLFVMQQFQQNDDPGQTEFKTGEGVNIQPVPVEADSAFMGTLVIQVSATGLAQAVRQVDIIPLASGTLIELHGKEGKTIKKGGLICRLDNTEYQLSADEAEDRVMSTENQFIDQYFSRSQNVSIRAEESGGSHRQWFEDMNEKEYQQAKDAFARGEITEEDLKEARFWYEIGLAMANRDRRTNVANRTGLSAALIARRRALLNLERTEIRAPFDGILADQDAHEGQYVSQGTALFKLVDISAMRIEVRCLESEVGYIQPGRKAEITVPAYPDQIFTGIVAAVNPLVDPETKTCRVTVEMDNPEKKLKSGMFAFVKLEAQIHKNRFLVPKDAIIVRNNRELVFIARDGRAVWSYVDTGLSNDRYVEILGSRMELKPGEQVLTNGHYTMSHDAPVRIVNKLRD